MSSDLSGEKMIAQMKALWCSGIEELGITSELTTQYFNNTMELYKEPHRKYHTYVHIYNLCQEWLKHKDKLENPLAVLFAIFFHDRIYSVTAVDGENEKRSAQNAIGFFRNADEANELESFYLRVYQLVDFTRNHKCPVDDSDAQIFLDMDMLILSADSDTYDIYAEQIREEFKDVPLKIYNKMRVYRFLKPTLASEKIYLSDIYKDREEQARANLKRELTQLTT